MGSLLLACALLVDAEDAIRLSVDCDGDSRLDLDLMRFWILALLDDLLLCEDAPESVFAMLGLGALNAEFRELPLRTDRIVGLAVNGSSKVGVGKPWCSRRMDPGSSAGKFSADGDGKEKERGLPGRGLLCCSGLLDRGESVMDGKRSRSFMADSRLDAELVDLALCRAGGGARGEP